MKNMKQIHFKVTTWEVFNIPEKTDVNEIIDLVNKKNIETSDEFLAYLEEKNINCEDLQNLDFLYESIEQMTISENNGNATIEIIHDENGEEFTWKNN